MNRSYRLLRLLLPLALLLGLLAGLAGPRVLSGRAAPLGQTPAAHVVISEFRTRGPVVPGSPDLLGENNEFVEIFNPTSSAVDISGWQIRMVDSSVTISAEPVFPGSATIGPGERRLVVNSQGPSYLDLPRDLTFTGTITDDGGIALLDASNNTVDSVAMSAIPGYEEGPTGISFLPPMTDPATSYQRNGNGGTDTDVNSADFTLGIPDPQTSTPLTPTPTAPTPTASLTPTASRTPTITPPPPPTQFNIVINEVAWSGTLADADHEWIELYNRSGRDINLNGWYIQVTSFDHIIDLSAKTIPAGGYYLIARDDATFRQSNPAVTIDQVDAWDPLLEDDFEILTLFAPGSRIIDQTYVTRGQWPAGSVVNARSMERRVYTTVPGAVWVTYAGTHVSSDPRDVNGNFINGTPRKPNWNLSVTLTPSATPTRIVTRVPTRTKPPQPRPVINEFLPRAAFDWNQDGQVDVYDEFVEVANIGAADWNTSGWRMDTGEDSEAFVLPQTVVKVGERALFYARQSGLRLTDGGATLRLLSNTGVIYDAQTYTVVKTPDKSWCRMKDLSGSWFDDCFPTPNLPNSREGELPSLPPGTGLETPLCRLSDTLPEEFVLAECSPFGEEMWNSLFWDQSGWTGDQPVPQDGSKWEVSIE